VIIGWLKSGFVDAAIVFHLVTMPVTKMFTENYQPWRGDSLTSLAVIRELPGRLARVCYDTPEIRSILSNATTRQEVLSQINGHPYFEVPPGTKCKIAGRSALRCAGSTYTSVFVWIKISSGPSRGKEGLICDAELARIVSLP
jgi:hypothetical protein